MLTDNAIAFAQDRVSKEWSFAYYIENARSRLQKLANDGHNDKELPLTPQIKKPTAQDYWECLHVAFEKAVVRLQMDMSRLAGQNVPERDT